MFAFPAAFRYFHPMKTLLHASPGETDLSWDLYAVAILGLVGVFQVLQWPILPKFMDIYYHLAVMKGFYAAGGYVTHAFWEYAPVGRPHLYPPLLHLFMLLLYQCGLSEIFIGRLVSALVYPAVLLALWISSRQLFGKRVAFFALLICTSLFSLYLGVETLEPFSLAFVFGILAFLAVVKNNSRSAILCLTLCFYTHVLMAFAVAVSLLGYGVLDRAKWAPAGRVVLGGVLFASPLLYFQWVHRSYFTLLDVRENYHIELYPAVYGLAALGLWLAVKRKGVFFLPVSLALGMGILLFGHPLRFFSGLGLVGFIWLAALAVDFLYEKAGGSAVGRLPACVAFVIGAVLFFHCLAPTLLWDVKKNDLHFNGTFVRHFNNGGADVKNASFYFPEGYQPIIDMVRRHTAANEIIWANSSYAGGIIGLLSGRATSSAMMREVRPSRAFDPVKSAKVLIWFKNSDGQVPEGMAASVAGNGLQLIAQTDYAYVFKNPAAVPGVDPTRPRVPTVAIDFGFIALALSVFWTVLKHRRLSKKSLGT